MEISTTHSVLPSRNHLRTLSLLQLLARLRSFIIVLFIQENRNELLAQEIIELMPMPSTSLENSNAAAILVSTGNIKNDDDDEGEGNKNDFLDEEKIEILLMPSSSQGNINAAAILKSTENIDGDDDDEEEADNFTTQQLFSFAWQIAKGMVGINMRVQHRLCPSRFPPLFCASSRHPAQRNVSIPIPPACTCQHAIDVNVTGRLVLKWIENTLYCFRTKGNIPEIRT